MRIFAFLLVLGFCYTSPVLAQDTDDDDDFSMYDNLDFADTGSKRYASQKVVGMTPARLISIGYDIEGAQRVLAAPFTRGITNVPVGAENMDLKMVHGVRLGAGIPIYSRNSLIIQGNFNYWESRYVADGSGYQHEFNQLLSEYTHRTTGLGTTVFKPLNETNFIIVQASADMSGDYALTEFQGFQYLRYSIAALYGWKKSDRLMYGFGLARTYRVGELNYIPVVLYNWTDKDTKWGAEVLIPARAHMRYNINPRNMLLFGFELQGQTYRMNNSNSAAWGYDNVELRRGQIRPRVAWERQLSGFVWLASEVGYRINYNFHTDHVKDGKDFGRVFGLLDDRPFLMENELRNTWYLNFTISLVSP